MSNEFSMPVRSRLFPALLALAVALALVFVSLFGAQDSFTEMDRVTRTRADARTVRLQAVQVFSLLKDIETGARGFALTGQDIYLEPHVVASKELPAAYAALKDAHLRAVGTSHDWSRLDGAVAARTGFSRELIAERRKLGKRVMDDQHLFLLGKQSMDMIRAELGRHDEAMAVSIEALDQRVRSLRADAIRSGWLLGGATIVLVTLAVGLLLRERALRKQMEEALRDSNLALDDRVRQRTAELAAARDRIADFAAEQNERIEAERRRLSREVHDQLGQIFSAQRMLLRGLPAGSVPQDQMQILEDAIGLGVTTVRRIAAELRPPLLDDLGLEAAVKHLAGQHFSASGISADVRFADAGALPEATALTIYRILQEACTNVVRHAAASKVAIVGHPEAGRYVVEVLDNGRGLGGGRQGALGVVGMQERAALIGGRVQVQNANEAGAEAGTRVLIDVPLVAAKEASDENTAA